ncbi:hypothetical protein CYMTET_11783 [Cymbomonas tetramitiformis]|uniref:Uncharacterized protein n=1 Tax=Cymbomonas tetramitiformis TaxID=36881 RepID=A0AAE0GLT1_9CHLO|nr:hypothetical protein CYMTET_11783 [Cymbomonas tetramitiformis]
MEPAVPPSNMLTDMKVISPMPPTLGASEMTKACPRTRFAAKRISGVWPPLAVQLDSPVQHPLPSGGESAEDSPPLETCGSPRIRGVSPCRVRPGRTKRTAINVEVEAADTELPGSPNKRRTSRSTGLTPTLDGLAMFDKKTSKVMRSSNSISSGGELVVFGSSSGEFCAMGTRVSSSGERGQGSSEFVPRPSRLSATNSSTSIDNSGSFLKEQPVFSMGLSSLEEENARRSRVSRTRRRRQQQIAKELSLRMRTGKLFAKLRGAFFLLLLFQQVRRRRMPEKKIPTPRRASSWNFSPGMLVAGRLKRERTSIKDLKTEGKVKFQVTKKQAVTVPYCLQGNEDMYTDDMIAQRTNLREHAAVIQALEKWWAMLPTTFGELARPTYIQMSLSIGKVLFPKFVHIQALAMAEEDWKEDAQGRKATMTKPMLQDALFQLADLWTEGVSPSEYAEFLDALFTDVTCHGADDAGPPVLRPLARVHSRSPRLVNASTTAGRRWGNIQKALSPLRLKLGGKSPLLTSMENADGGAEQSTPEDADGMCLSPRDQRAFVRSKIRDNLSSSLPAVQMGRLPTPPLTPMSERGHMPSPLQSARARLALNPEDLELCAAASIAPAAVSSYRATSEPRRRGNNLRRLKLPEIKCLPSGLSLGVSPRSKQCVKSPTSPKIWRHPFAARAPPAEEKTEGRQTPDVVRRFRHRRIRMENEWSVDIIRKSAVLGTRTRASMDTPAITMVPGPDTSGQHQVDTSNESC